MKKIKPIYTRRRWDMRQLVVRLAWNAARLGAFILALTIGVIVAQYLWTIAPHLCDIVVIISLGVVMIASVLDAIKSAKENKNE